MFKITDYWNQKHFFILASTHNFQGDLQIESYGTLHCLNVVYLSIPTLSSQNLFQVQIGSTIWWAFKSFLIKVGICGASRPTSKKTETGQQSGRSTLAVTARKDLSVKTCVLQFYLHFLHPNIGRLNDAAALRESSELHKQFSFPSLITAIAFSMPILFSVIWLCSTLLYCYTWQLHVVQ